MLDRIIRGNRKAFSLVRKRQRLQLIGPVA